MPAEAGAWVCPVCEGVNRSGRVCTTCGEQLPEGFVPRAATRQPVEPITASPTVVPRPRTRAPSGPTPAEIYGSDPFR